MQPDDVFAGRYRVERVLGRGGMGIVYLVNDERLHRLDALKVMSGALSHDPTFRQRFEREAKAAARFEHPNVVQLRHYDESDGTLYLVMQYVEGPNLRAELSSNGRMSPQRTAEVVGQVAQGLDAAHRAGQVHRDVKPANVLIGRDADGGDRVLLTDFGIAQPLHGTQDRLTSAGALMGTIAYASPEQLRGEPASVQSDVYALACVAYECLSGRPPFSGGSGVEVAEAHLRHAPTLLSLLVPGVPTPVAEAVNAGLAKRPGDRPPTAGMFARQLTDAVRDAEMKAPADTTQLLIGSEAETSRSTSTEPFASTPAAAGGRRALLAAAAVVLAGFGVGAGAGYANGGAAASPHSTSTPKPGPVDPHAALIAKLPRAIYAGCAADPGRERAERLTALSCASALAGVDQLLVLRWRDSASMTADFAATSKQRPQGKCGKYTGQPANGLQSTWSDTDAPLACYINANGAAIVLWEYPQSSLQVLAVRKDGDAQAAFVWWSQAVKTPLT